jgi:hypothetical protein
LSSRRLCLPSNVAPNKGDGSCSWEEFSRKTASGLRASRWHNSTSK